MEQVEPILDAEMPLWKEHPRLGAKADFVALPLTALDDVELLPYTIWVDVKDRFLVGPSDTVSVIGFPFGRSVDGMAIWASGFVASEPQVDFDDLPIFLIDCRTRQGQSGSPVIFYRTGGMVSTATDSRMFNGPVHQFMGIYSGRINAESDIGMVWKASAVQELVDSFDPAKVSYSSSRPVPKMTYMGVPIEKGKSFKA